MKKMKNSNFTFAVLMLLVVFAIFSGCESSSKKVDNAQNDVTKANEALDEANAEYLADIEVYRKEKTDLIAFNDSSIVALKSKIAKEKKEVKADYEKKIAELEQKNRDLKTKMGEYKDEGKERWESFKREFNHDMEELGIALKDLTVNNKK
jgi:cell shape-determining protein MreC